MPCWPAHSNWRSSTSPKNDPNHQSSPPAYLSSPTPTMKSSTQRSNGHVASSADYDTPPWRIDQPNVGLTNRSSPSGAMNGNNCTSEKSLTRNPAFYEPDVTSWKIGPSLLSPGRNTANRSPPVTTCWDNRKQDPSTSGYSQTNGISPSSLRFENGNQSPFLDNHTFHPRTETSASNMSHSPSSNGYDQIIKPFQTSTMYKNGNRYANNLVQELSPGSQTPTSSNRSVYTYSAPNGTTWVTDNPLRNQNGPTPFDRVKPNGSLSPIPIYHNGHTVTSLGPMQTTRSDAPTLANRNGPTQSSFESIGSPRTGSPIHAHQNGPTMTPVELMTTARSGSPIPANHNGSNGPTFGPDRTTGLRSPVLNRRETLQRITHMPKAQGTPKTGPSEWAFRPANPHEQGRFRTLSPTSKTYGTGPRNASVSDENSRSNMTLQKYPNSGSGPDKIDRVTGRPSWNSSTAGNGPVGYIEKIFVTEDEYRFGREIKLSTSRFASNANLPADYFDKIFEEAGMPTMPDHDVIETTYPSPKGWPSSNDDRWNTTGSSGYDSPTYPPSPFSLPHQPTHPGSYQPQSPHDTTIHSPSKSKDVDPRQPSQPAVAPIKGRSSTADKEPTSPGIRTLRENCIQAGQLYRDQQFPAESKSLYFSRAPWVHGTIEWKRPFEICNDPQFVVDERDRFDVVQGQIGNCWLVAAIAGLTLNQKLLERVCPVSQSFDKTYAGVFHFRFWRFGKWVEVIVDDRLPTVQGRLVYLHSSKPNEFWSALTEKAYAKIVGTYEALEGGITSEGVTDLTGGIVESLNLREKKNPWNILLKAFQKGSIMGCGIDPTPGITEQELANGLVCGHAYTVTSMKQFKLPGQGQPIQLIRLRNPWGSEHEWKGAWSDRSSDWQRVPQSVRAEMGLTTRADGEFWMSFDDFRYNFHSVDMCHLPPDALEGGNHWKVTQREGAWVPGVSSGGCANHQDTFHTNPQYRVRLSEPDDGDQDGLCTVIISMTQKDRRKKASEGAKNLAIGYSVLKAPVGTTGPLDRSTLRRCETVATVPTFVNSRDISYRHELPPGDYIIIPSTFNPHLQGEFLLRIYTEKAADNRELDEETRLTETPLNSTAPTPIEKKREDDMMNSFDLVAGEDGEIDAWELKKLVTLMFSKDFPQFEGFGNEAARSMIAMHDGDMSGKLCKEEFVNVYNELNTWKNAFKEYDADKSGAMDIHELRSAFKTFGFTLSNRLLVAIGRRYANKAGVIDIQDFILCACRLKTIIQTYQAHKTNGGSTATIPAEEFITSMMYS